jgi:hypothetical protein
LSEDKKGTGEIPVRLRNSVRPGGMCLKYFVSYLRVGIALRLNVRGLVRSEIMP